MAGEWIKFECTLPEKPEVLAITAALGLDDPDATVGKLMRLFRWFDQHTTDGNAARVTPALLDKAIGVTGLTQAVIDVGWLHLDPSGLRLEKFDRHNGSSAKARAQTAKRVANHRSNAESTDSRNAASVTSALAREEKRREERNTPLPPKGELEGFVRFWSCWPKSDRKGGRSKCAEVWAKVGAEAQADAVLAHVQAMKRSSDWTREGGRFIPMPTTYLNRRAWDGADGGGAVGGNWWAAAGFENEHEARNAHCFAHNAAEFRDGKRLEAA
jgi:hypothetical protein